MVLHSGSWRSAVVGVAVFFVLGLGLFGCSSEDGTDPFRLTGPSDVQEGDTVWVAVTMEEDLRQEVSNAQFQLHYTTAHLKGLRYELGPDVQREGANVEHYPSKASYDFGLYLPDGAEAAEAAPIVRVQFRVQETAPRGVPSHLRLADVELLRKDGSMRRLASSGSMRIGIRSTGEEDQTQEATLDIGDQYTLKDTITVGDVAAPTSGRIVVRGTESDGTERIVAQKDVSPGRHENVKIGLDPEFGLSEKQFAFLEAGLYRVDTANGLGRRFQSGGTPVQSTFTAHYRTSTPESEIIVHNKPLTDHTLVVDSVIATEPADLVIHRNRHGGPLIPGIIGKARVGTGVNRDVEVEIYEDETVVCGETLWPMLHVRSESEDQPYEIDYPIITEPVIIECG